MPQGRQPGRSAEEGACTAPQQPSSAWLDHQEAERHNKVHVRGASSCLPSRLAPAAAPCHCPTFLSRCQAPRIAQGARAQREQRGRCLRRRPWATRHLAGRVDGGPCQQARSHRRGNTRPWRTRPAETRRLGTALRCPPPPPPHALPFQPAHLSPAPWQRIEAGKDDIDEEPLPARAAASLSQQPALEQPTHLTTASTSPYSPPQRPAAPAAHQPMMQPQPQQFALDILSTPASQAAASSSGALLGLSRRPRATAAPMPPPLLTRCVPPTRRRQ
jgi:hypothetical protein